ncbi:MAG: DUF2512 family protein [Psychrobacillus sp.]
MYIKAFLIKFIMTTAVVWIVLGYYGVEIMDIFITSIALTVLGFVGDIFLMPKIGNMLATAGDFILALAVVWLIGIYLFDPSVPVGRAAFIISLVLIIGEMFLHQYIKLHIFEPRITNPKDKAGYYQRTDTQLELERAYKEEFNKE